MYQLVSGKDWPHTLNGAEFTHKDLKVHKLNNEAIAVTIKVSNFQKLIAFQQPPAEGNDYQWIHKDFRRSK